MHVTKVQYERVFMIIVDMHELHREDAWYFFTRRVRKYPNGTLPSRSVADGYWKPVSINHKVMLKKDIVGHKRNFDFYEGKQPEGKKTRWKMQEYTIHNPTTAPTEDANGVRSVCLDFYNSILLNLFP